MRNLLTICGGFILLFVSGITGTDQAASKETGPLRELARELIDGLDRSGEKPKNCKKMSGTLPFGDKLCRKRTKLRIALRPFLKEKIPVAPEVAGAFNDELLTQLIRQADGRYEFVSRSELPAIIKELFEFSDTADTPINELLKRVADIDVLILGKLLLRNSSAIVSYKALGMDGDILASTGQQKIPLSPKDAKATQSMVTVDQAIIHAARELAGKATDMNTLVLGSVVFETSGAQPPFGRFVKERLSIALQDAFTDILTGRKLKVIRRRDGKPGGGRRSYLLQGSYWDLSESVELRASLRNQDSEVVSSVGWIRPETIRQRLGPVGDFGAIRDNDGLGPFKFHLTSDRGKDPVYYIDDILKLKILLSHDAWVYCFDYSPDGKVYQLFPNPRFWKKHKELRLSGGVPIMVPGEKNKELFPYQLVVAGPPGNELIKCFAASRDVTSELPKELRGLSDDALPQNIVESLPSRFQQLPDVAISEASFIMTIPE